MGFASYELTEGPHRGELGGYAEEAICDLEGCSAPIDRGLWHLCGGEVPGSGYESDGCGGYFCGEHLAWDSLCFECHDKATVGVCPDCLGDGDIANAVDPTDFVGCPTCENSGSLPETN